MVCLSLWTDNISWRIDSLEERESISFVRTKRFRIQFHRWHFYIWYKRKMTLVLILTYSVASRFLPSTSTTRSVYQHHQNQDQREDTNFLWFHFFTTFCNQKSDLIRPEFHYFWRVEFTSLKREHNPSKLHLSKR